MGFTLIELLTVLGVITLLGLLAIPVLANGKSGSQRAVCASNLSRIGRALAVWGTEHGDLYPWQVDWSLGGTRNEPSGLNANLWFQFDWVSNELVTPKVLACPSDRLARIAQDFSSASNGLVHPTHRNNAVSYTLSHPYPEDGRLVLSSDRSMRPDGGATASCGQFRGGVVYTFTQIPNSGAWGPFMHLDGGNLLFNDGSVEQVDDNGLRKAIDLYDRVVDTVDRPSRPHFLFPRNPTISATDN